MTPTLEYLFKYRGDYYLSQPYYQFWSETQRLRNYQGTSVVQTWTDVTIPAKYNRLLRELCLNTQR